MKNAHRHFERSAVLASPLLLVLASSCSSESPEPAAPVSNAGSTFVPPPAAGTGGSGVVSPPTAGTPGVGGSGGQVALGGMGGMGGMGGASVDPTPTLPPDAPLPPCVRTVPVGANGELGGALDGLQAGDCVVLADGEYRFPTITATGTEQAPIVIRAENVLGVTVNEGNLLVEESAYVVVEGIHFRSSGYVELNDCDHCRITRFRMERREVGGEIDWLTVDGTSKYCRLDHNDFGPQNQVANYVMLRGTGDQTVQYTRIDHNYFHDVNYGGGNNWEIIRAGLSNWSFSSAYTIIEHNLFVRADSDPETISVKSSDNIVRYNTMRETRGQFTLRHGNRNQVYGNYILGDGRGSEGIRVYGGDHKIFNNYLGNLGGYGILLDAGTNPDNQGQLTDHKQVYNAEVVFNTFVNAGLEIGGSKRLPPENVTVAYNLFAGDGMNVRGGADVTSIDNMEGDGGLVEMGDVSKPGGSSPVIDGGDASMFPYVVDDIDGKPRMMPDIGADEVSSAQPLYRILTEADVGPMAP